VEAIANEDFLCEFCAWHDITHSFTLWHTQSYGDKVLTALDRWHVTVSSISDMTHPRVTSFSRHAMTRTNLATMLGRSTETTMNPRTRFSVCRTSGPSVKTVVTWSYPLEALLRFPIVNKDFRKTKQTQK
jgi:hypothetical protein